MTMRMAVARLMLAGGLLSTGAVSAHQSIDSLETLQQLFEQREYMAVIERGEPRGSPPPPPSTSCPRGLSTSWIFPLSLWTTVAT